MKRLLMRVASVVFALAVMIPSLSRGQGYPMPGSDSQPPVLCKTCLGAYKNLPTYPYSAPIKAFAGRYVDSQATRDYQHGTGYRTVRAKKVMTAPELNRVYIVQGEGLEIWDYNRFFTQKLRPDGSTLERAPGRADPGSTREMYLRGDQTIYAEYGGGWETFTMDGQERLFDADYDDRGYVYLAYEVFGWGIHQDAGSSMPLMKQIKDVQGKAIVTARSGSNYYAIVSDGGQSYLYDTTNPTNPIQLAVHDASITWITATRGANSTIAMIDGAGTLKFYTVDGFKTKQPMMTVAGKEYRSVATDGTNFYGARRNELVKFSPSGNQFSQQSYPMDLINPTILRYGVGGFLAAAGYQGDGTLTGRAWRLENGAPKHIDLGDFIRKYYTNPPAGYAKPVGWTDFARDIRVEKHLNKVYLFWSGHGLGDVYELQAADTIDIDVNTAAGYGTPNPYSGSQGPLYYGDPITFKSTFNSGPAQIQWNFDNLGAAGNNPINLTGQSLTYQYSGLTNTTAITKPRNVTAAVVGDSSNADSVVVNMSAPIIRLGVESTDILFLQPNASSPAPIVLGDRFVDASDGSVQGHYTKWTLDGTSADRTPSQPQPAGACGAHSLSMAPAYGPYTISGSVAVQSALAAYEPSPISVGYTVRPFVPGIAVQSKSGNSLTFRNATRVGAATAFAGGASTPVDATWSYVDASGADLVPPVNRALTLGTLASDTYTISTKVAGAKVVLSISIAPAQIPDASCASLASATSTFELTIPDPDMTLSGCLTAKQPCTATASSLSGQNTSDWSYLWTLDSTNVGTTKTIDISSILLAGQHTLVLTASNSIGSATDQQTWTVAVPACNGAPRTPSITAVGNVTGCTTCTTNEQMRFEPYFFNYTMQECDTLEWSWGDGSAKTVTTNKTTLHTFPGNGPYTVSLVVKNDDGQTSATRNIQFGGSTPPPNNPPPTNPNCPTVAPGQNAEFSLSCGIGCAANQTITFQYSNWGYTAQTCDTYAWSFGDGTSSTAMNPQKSYGNAGTYDVTLRVTNQLGSVTKTKSVTIGGGGTTPPPVGTCSTAPTGSMSMSWLGDVSKCSSGANCNPNENIVFTGFAFGYSPQTCDTWEWNFGDGSTGTGKTVTHKYPNGGSYTVTVKLRNSAGANTGATGSVLVQNLNIAKPTNVNFTTSVTTPVVGKEVTFTGSATTPSEGPITSWQWSFGDGGTASGQTVKHTYSTPGPWNVSLVASNAGGPSPTLTREIRVAAENAWAFLLPVVTHGAGHAGSLWRTDLQIYYPYQGEEVELEFELRSATLAVTKTMRLDRSTLISEDFMSFFTSGDNSGPVIVRGNTEKLPQIWTRTYNVAANGIGTYGQLIPAVRLDTNENSATGPTTYYLPGVRLTDDFRTNIGLLNISGSTITVTLTAFEDSFGAAIGQFHQTLEPYRFIQIGDGALRTNFAGHSREKAFSVMISGADEGALIAYESMIDNVSNDPVYVSAVPASLASDPGMKNQIVPGVGLFQSWKSDVAIFNPDDQAVQFDLRFFDEKGLLLSEAQNRILPAKGTLQINDIVNAPEMTPVVGKDVIGTLRLDVDSPLADKFPVVTDRTYNDQGAAGTFGQGIIGIPMSRPNVRTGKPAILPAVRQDLSYYTNLGLVNLGTEPSTVLVSLLDKQSGQPIGTWSATLAAGESIVASRILQAINATADNGSLKIEVTSGAPVWAYASVIDQMTKDPEYVPAVPLD